MFFNIFDYQQVSASLQTMSTSHNMLETHINISGIRSNVLTHVSKHITTYLKSITHTSKTNRKQSILFCFTTRAVLGAGRRGTSSRALRRLSITKHASCVHNCINTQCDVICSEQDCTNKYKYGLVTKSAIQLENRISNSDRQTLSSGPTHSMRIPLYC